MRTINERWKNFEAKVLPKDACDIQRSEMKRAFFGGFAECYSAITDDVPAMSDDDAELALKSLAMQLLGFVEAVKMGAA